MGKIGCVFDMDGVLFLSSDVHYQAFCDALADEPVEVPYYHELAGMRTDTAIRKIFADFAVDLPKDKLKRLTSLKRMYATKKLHNRPPVAPNCWDVLNKLFQRGIILGLASSSSSKNVRLFLESSGSKDFFSVVLSGDDVSHAKPDPEIYIMACNGMGVESEDCIAIEDSMSGILAAKAAGMRIIGMLEQHKQHEYEMLGLTGVVSSLDELLKLKILRKRI